MQNASVLGAVGNTAKTDEIKDVRSDTQTDVDWWACQISMWFTKAANYIINRVAALELQTVIEEVHFKDRLDVSDTIKIKSII